MKVLHVQKSAGIGGSERHLVALLPALARRGVEVGMVVLAAPGAGAFTAALLAAGVPVTEISAGPDLNPVLVARLAACIRRERPDLVHTHLIHADVHGQPAARLARVPAVSSVHGAHPFYRRQPFRSAAAVAGRLAGRTIAISHHVAATLAEARIVPSERLRVVHYGIDAAPWQQALANRDEARRRFGLDGCAPVVGIASRLIPHKGHAELLRAVAVAAGRGVPLRLAVAGDGPIRTELERLARDLGVAERVRFLGFVSDVAAFMAACDVVVFPTQPTLGEGFGLAALEAMAAGRPVVATQVASLPEVVADGETGLLVPPGDPEALADALARLAADEKLRARLGAAGARRAAERFSLEAMVESTLRVYAETLEPA